MGRTTPEKQREYYLKWKTTRNPTYCTTTAKSRWLHITATFRHILIDDVVGLRKGRCLGANSSVGKLS